MYALRIDSGAPFAILNLRFPMLPDGGVTEPPEPTNEITWLFAKLSATPALKWTLLPITRPNEVTSTNTPDVPGPSITIDEAAPA